MGNIEISLMKDPVTIRNAVETQVRTGEIGNIGVAQYFGSDYFFGEVLEGHWKRFEESAGMPSDPFVVKLNSGDLECSCDTDTGGNYQSGWIVSDAMLPLFPGLVLDVHLELSALASTSEVYWRLIIVDRYPDPSQPTSQVNYIDIAIYATTTNYYARVQKNLEGTASNVYTATAMSNSEGTFRMKILRDGKFEFYLHDGAGDVSEEDDQIVTQTDLDLNFNLGWVCYEFTTGDTANRTASSEKVTVSYPDHMSPKFVRASLATDYFEGEVKARNYDEDAGLWPLNVLHPSHIDLPVASARNFAVENSLMWWRMQEAWRFMPSYYREGVGWQLIADNFYVHLLDDAVSCITAYPRGFKKISRTEIVYQFRLCEDAIDDEDFYVDMECTLRAGQLFATFRILKIHPEQNFYISWYQWTPRHRWGYVCDAETHGIGDDDLGLTSSNTTMSDNWAIFFDDTFTATQYTLAVFAVNKKPDTVADGSYSQAWDGASPVSWRAYQPHHIKDLEIYLGVTEFPDINHLFLEAEDGIYGGTARTIDRTGDSGTSCELMVNPDYVRYQFTAGTDLPAGRYMALFRIQDLNQVTNGVGLRVYNSTDSEYRNEEGAQRTITATSAWNYWQLVFEITDADVSGTDTIFLEVQQVQPSNDVWIDYFLIIPVGNGNDWPQDLAHNALRRHDNIYRVHKKTGDDRQVG